MKRVLIIGANGNIGKKIVTLLQEEGKYAPVAMVRKAAQEEQFKVQNVETVLADLESGVDDIARAMVGCDAIIFTAGSGGHTGHDKTLLIDLDGAAKSIEAAEKMGIERFIMVSSIYAERREKWTMLQPYFVAKHHADLALLASTLNYTIVRPGILTDEAGTNRVQIGQQLEANEISRQDVARTIVEVLDAKNMEYKAFDVISGTDVVGEAVQKF